MKSNEKDKLLKNLGESIKKYNELVSKYPHKGLRIAIHPPVKIRVTKKRREVISGLTRELNKDIIPSGGNLEKLKNLVVSYSKIIAPKAKINKKQSLVSISTTASNEIRKQMGMLSHSDEQYRKNFLKSLLRVGAFKAYGMLSKDTKAIFTLLSLGFSIPETYKDADNYLEFFTDAELESMGFTDDEESNLNVKLKDTKHGKTITAKIIKTLKIA